LNTKWYQPNKYHLMELSQTTCWAWHDKVSNVGETTRIFDSLHLPIASQMWSSGFVFILAS